MIERASPKRIRAEDAARTFFVRWLTLYANKVFGEPHPKLVCDIVNWAFADSKRVSESQVIGVTKDIRKSKTRKRAD